MPSYYCGRCDAAVTKKPKKNPVDGSYLCVRCMERIVTCKTCGSKVYSGETTTPRIYVGSSDEANITACFKCIDSVSKIRNYTFTPPMHFFFDEETESLKNSDFFGTEVEVQFRAGTPINQVSSIFNKNAFCWTTFDSSVGHGFELKILPMTLKYLEKNGDECLRELWDLVNHPAKNKNPSGLGMHVHLNSTRFEYDDELTLASFFMRDPVWSAKFGKRTQAEAERWFADLYRRYPAQTPIECRETMLRGRHYVPITKTSKRPTYEVRVFRSTVDPKVYIDRIRTLQNIKDFCRIYRLDPDEPVNHKDLLSDYRDWVTANSKQKGDLICV